jgi:hypothetical protein
MGWICAECPGSGAYAAAVGVCVGGLAAVLLNVVHQRVQEQRARNFLSGAAQRIGAFVFYVYAAQKVDDFHSILEDLPLRMQQHIDRPSSPHVSAS